MEEFITLIRRSQAGDAEAYGALVGRFQNMAYGYAAAILDDFHLAQDAAQEAFIEAYRRLPELREPLAFPAWLKRIVFKHCDRLTRRRHPAQSPLDESQDMVSRAPDPAEIVEEQELAERVQAAIRGLPVEQRVVTTLFYIDGYSHGEIAAFLELPAQTVKSRLHTSRRRLKERMMDMVQDELNAHKLPERFTRETVDKALAQAQTLIGERQYEQAEHLLREILTQLPDHPAALKELNRALIHGRVYGQGRWDLLPEVARQGQRILEATDDEAVCRDLAKTFLAIPAMAEAVDFIGSWIARKGNNLERLGMLAWAKGCLADYVSAEKLWQELCELAHSQKPDEILAHVPFIAYTLVDCFAKSSEGFAGPGEGFTGYGEGFENFSELERARRVVQQAWDLCGDLGPVPFGHGTFADGVWMMIFHQARLDMQTIAPQLLRRHTQDDPAEQGMSLYLRAWVEDVERVSADWLAWVRQRIATQEWPLIEQFRPILWALRGHGLWDEANRLAQATWDALGKSQGEEAEQARTPWGWERFNPVGAIQKKDWATAETISRHVGGAWAIVIAAAQGTPTPPELVQAAEQHGIESVDEYGLFGWYLQARQAAFAGEAEKAFAALEKSLSYWANGPYFYVNIWEQDRCWDGLRQREEFQRLFAEKRRQIGPIHGLLHYFPGW